MDKTEIENIVQKQREFFLTGKTLDVKFRISVLKKLRSAIYKYEDEIKAALKSDLGKSGFESYMCEVGLSLSETSYMIMHAAKFSKEKTVYTPIANFHSRSYKKPSPHGVVLVMSPWNYPFLLTIEPVVDAIAAGNTVVVKPSAYSPATSAVMEKLLSEVFPPEYVKVITGGRAENTALLETHFDYIFFTGSKAVGKTVMEAASKFLTPVTLELGGKSPCIVEKSANIKLAAKRIVWGKFLNLGQTCVAPDYILCDESIKDAFIIAVKKEIEKQFGLEPLKNPDYGRIINQKHFDRVCGLIDSDKVVHGGKWDTNTLQIEPTVMDNVSFNDCVMQEEIFGPVMPIISYNDIDDVISRINSMQHPLALYIFTNKNRIAKNVISRTGFGGGCINDVVVHLSTTELAFGGFGESGMGSYHGKQGFETFSHTKNIMDKKQWIDLPMRYQPFKSLYGKLLRMFLK
ncbi:MAG: aldehyde dehydrogenase [Treponema sp.]|nr:aldehyde dehydrogenase [Treponema sp.]